MNYNEGYVKCPFYKENAPKDMIVCEGVEDHMVIEHKFMYRSEEKKKEKKKEYMDAYCCGDYEKCYVCKMLMAKYEAKET